MAETVGQHSVAAFTSPVNGTTPIDANTVRGNDNTVRSAYVDHDADPGIHVQSSSLASRPVAGTVGRKWITVSSGRYQLWYDDGSRWHEVASDAVNVDCLADANLTKGDVVKITGFNNGQNLPTVNKVSSSTDTAFGIVENTVTSGNLVQIVNTGLIEDVDTNGYAVGTILYPNSSGGWTSTKPTSGSYQPAGYVLRGNTNNGVLYVEFSAPRIVERSDNTASTLVLRDASGNFAAGTITAGALTSTGLVTFASLKGTGATTVTNILDEDNMASDSATALATQQSIKAYVDSKVATVDTLAEVLANGNTTGATDIIVNAGQKIRTPAVAAQDGTAALTIADSTGTVTAAGTLNATTLGGTLSTAAQPNVTSVGTLTSLTVQSSGATTALTLKAPDNVGQIGLWSATSGTQKYAIYLASGTDFTLRDSVAAANRLSVDASGNLAVDTNTLYVDAANNRVGVGTASPSKTLTVQGDATFALDIMANSSGIATSGFYNGLGISGYDAIGWYGANVLAIGGYRASQWNSIELYTAGTKQATLTSSGNLGLGVTPTYRMQVYSDNSTAYSSSDFDSARNLVLQNVNTTTNANIGLQFVIGGTSEAAITGIRTAAGETALAFGTRGSGARTEKMRLDASGNLGVGATSPTQRLDVRGSIYAQRDTNPTNGIVAALTNQTTASNNGCRISFDAYNVGGASIGIPSTSASLVFYVNGDNTERARITSGGEFLVNATATVNASIASIVGTASTNVLALKNGDNGNYFLYCASTANAERLRIEGDGDVYNLNGTYGTISDIKHKQDVIDAPSQWDDLKAIRFRKYRMKVEVETNPDAPYLLGVVAQELEQTSPGLVDEQSEFEEQEVTDEDGNVTTERVQVGTTKTVKSSILLMKAAVALQEAMARIEALEVEVAALKANA